MIQPCLSSVEVTIRTLQVATGTIGVKVTVNADQSPTIVIKKEYGVILKPSDTLKLDEKINYREHVNVTIQKTWSIQTRLYLLISRTCKLDIKTTVDKTLQDKLEKGLPDRESQICSRWTKNLSITYNWVPNLYVTQCHNLKIFLVFPSAIKKVKIQ